ncbi:MAG TPA: hypothetical protein VIT91_14615 [Chthoniobacterales bacterium]
MSTKNETIELTDTPKFTPPKVAGDGDFGGHGPRVKVTARLTVRNDSELWTTVTMNAKETEEDYTEVNGSADFMMWKHNKPILRILSNAYSETTYTHTGHEDEVIPLGAGELVRQFLCVGDTRGDEAGTRTGVTVSFNPVTIEIPT